MLSEAVRIVQSKSPIVSFRVKDRGSTPAMRVLAGMCRIARKQRLIDNTKWEPLIAGARPAISHAHWITRAEKLFLIRVHPQYRPNTPTRNNPPKRIQHPDHHAKPPLITHLQLTIRLPELEILLQKRLYVGVLSDASGPVKHIFETLLRKVILVHLVKQAIIRI